jgi:hypothetical protein
MISFASIAPTLKNKAILLFYLRYWLAVGAFIL